MEPNYRGLRPTPVDVQRFLATHDGVISRAQARACGLSDDQIARKVASGEWIRRAPGVYFAIAWPWTPAAAVRVAAEWVSPVGTLAGPTAAWWLGLGIARPYPLTVIAPPGSSRRAPSGVSLTRRDLGSDRRRHRGLWVVSAELAALDAAVSLGRDGQSFLDRALQQRQVTLQGLRASQARHFGRRGSGAAHQLILRAGDRAASEAERLVIALLRRGAISGWEVNLEVALSDGRLAIVDVAFSAARFALEVDGWAFHCDPERFVGGRGRKRALVADGWAVAEVTWEDLVQRPEKVLDEVRRTLAHRTPAEP
jgi:very-short-patch-repair endonuclease